jgi:serine phosphatase RsbU (regulator of sigma subunit)
MTSALNNLARIHLLKNNISLAKQYAGKAYTLSKELGFPENIKKAASLMKEINFKSGNYKAAYDFFLEETLMRDSLEKKDNYKLAQQKQAKYFYEKIHESDSIAFAEQKKIRDEKQMAELEKQQAQLQVKENQQIFLFVGVGILILFIGFLYNRFMVIRSQKKIIEQQKILVEEKNREVLDSITYAKTIQDAILPSRELLNQYLKNGFVLYKPKDIVAGDFYWMYQKEKYIFVAVADCTGHGVPGAMVSVICSSALNRAVKEFNLVDPGKILEKVRELVIETFSKSEKEVYDGMDISLCCFQHLDENMQMSSAESLSENSILHWSGANNPLWIIRNNKLLEFAPDKQPIGKYFQAEPFTTHKIEIKKNDSLYMFSDGYADQFGGAKGKKFKYSNLQKIILDNVDLNPELQSKKLDRAFYDWKGDLEQIDDVCIIGIKI